MIIGGAYQGKLAYAKETFPDVRWTDGEQCEKEAIFQYRGIFHFHKYITIALGRRRYFRTGEAVEGEKSRFDFSDGRDWIWNRADGPISQRSTGNYRAHLHRAGERCKECDKSCLWNSDGN